MKFIDFLKKSLDEKRPTHLPYSIFEVTSPDGAAVLMCWADITFGCLSDIPNIENYEVTVESFTQDELDAYLAKRDLL